MESSQGRAPELKAGILFGIGLGGFFDGIVLHQLLQWHHMLSDQGSYPVDTIAGLEMNVFWDGLFHVVTYIAVVAGMVLLWRADVNPNSSWSTRQFVGMLSIGWGAFNLVEGLVNHQILGIHHVNETVPRDQWVWWDIAFLVWGSVMIIGGLLLVRSGQTKQDGASNHRSSPA